MGIIFKEKSMVDEKIEGCTNPAHKHTSTWNLALPLSALLLLAGLMLTVSNTSAVALSLAEQQGKSILLIEQRIKDVEDEVDEKTNDRYTSKEAEKDLNYIRDDIQELKEMIKEAHRVQ